MAEYHVAMRGFWLPCDQSGFIHHDRHRLLRKPLDLIEFDRSNERETLDDQVFHRLVMVLPDWGYTYAVPVKHVSVPYGEDPDAAVFVHERFSGKGARDFAEGVNAIPVPPQNISFHGLALLVNSSGFYLWLLRYQVTTGTHDEQVANRVQEYLKQYIHTIVGGDMWSRYSGWKDDAQLASPDELSQSLETYQNEHRGMLTFIQINTIFEGLFNSALDFRVFFFDNASEKPQEITAAKQEYSLGRFLDMISTHVDETHYRGTKSKPATHHETDIPVTSSTDNTTPDAHDGRDQPAHAHADVPTITLFLHGLNKAYPHPGHRFPATPELPADEADALCHDYLGEHGCGTLLLKFLQATASETLQDYKRRIERCRRALVTEILEVTQRQEGILQVEIPRAARDPGKSDEDRDKNDRIEGVTEAQLRGYVMLFSAKLPLIHNVQLYLKEITIHNHWYTQRYGSGRRGHDNTAAQANNQAPNNQAGNNQAGNNLADVASTDTQQVNAAIKMWTTLFDALRNDLQGLERAIKHEREDRMVQEEEKIRIEQETIAEIERLQDRNANSLSPQTTLTLGLLSNAFALASVIIAIISIGKNTPTLPSIGAGLYQPGALLAFLGAVLGLGLGLIALYFLAHYAFILVFRVASLLLRVRWSGRYYYEMDVHLEAPIEESKARELLEDRFMPEPFNGEFIQRVSKAHGAVAAAAPGIEFWDWIIRPAFGKPERNSYRVERQDANAAMHKVYVEVVAAVRREHWHELLRPRVDMVLVYEIYYHRPAQAPRYILKDLRVVSTQTKTLSATQLDQIKQMVMTSFVSPLVREGSPLRKGAQQVADGAATIPDALMSLTDESTTAVSSVERERNAFLNWVKDRLHASAQLLLRVGVFGYALFVGRAVVDLATLSNNKGFGALGNENALMQAFMLVDERTFIMAYLPIIIAVPIAAALVVAVGAWLIATRSGRVRRSIIEALELSDQEVAQRRNAKRPQQNGASKGESKGDAQGESKGDAQGDARMTGASAPATQSTPTLPWWLRAWRGLVVSAWFAVGMAGRFTKGVLLVSSIVLVAALGWLGVAVGLPVIAEIWRWVSLVPHL